MANQYRLKKRGVAHGMSVALGLRGVMREDFKTFLSHALIVLAEDYPPTNWDATESPDPWYDLMMLSGTVVYSSIISQKWPILPHGIALMPDHSHLHFSLYGPSSFPTTEYEHYFADDDRFLNYGPFEHEALSYGDYVYECLTAEIVSDQTLHTMISKVTVELQTAGQSYVKAPSFRRHRKMIHEIIAAGEKQGEQPEQNPGA